MGVYCVEVKKGLSGFRMGMKEVNCRMRTGGVGGVEGVGGL